MKRYEKRDYQEIVFKHIMHTLSVKKDYLLQAPCGAGKTVVFSMICEKMYKKNRRVLVLLDREILVSQTALSICDFIGNSNPVSIACASTGTKQTNQITVASRQTFFPMLKTMPDYYVNLLIFDEAHLFNQDDGQFFEIFEILSKRYEKMRYFGCTATPYRLKSGYIYGAKKIFTGLDYKITTAELTAQNYLVPMRFKCRKSNIIEALNNLKPTSTGELNEKEQFEIVKQTVFIESLYLVWTEHCKNRKTAIFAINIAHAELIAEHFRKINTPVFIIHSKLSSILVNQIITQFIQTENSIIINVGMLTLGSDIPSISAIILARKTLSTALFFQIIGRGTRLNPPKKKDCLCIDLCGNFALHGSDPDKPRLIIDNDKKTSPEKICPVCEEYLGLATKICPVCGFKFPIANEENSDKTDMRETEKAGEIIDYNDDIIEVDISYISYKYHQSVSGKTPTVWAKYFADNSLIASKWFCPEHPQGSFPQKQAVQYWNEFWGKDPAPETVEDFVDRQGELAPKARIKIKTAGKYPEIVEIENTTF